MSFSKRTLISAALFLGAVTGTPVSAFAEKWDDNRQGNITVTDNLEIEIAEGKSYTLNGSFLSENGSYLDALINGTPSEDSQTVTISGGGTLQYTGSAGSGYYTGNYSLTRGDTYAAVAGNRVFEAWRGFDSFLSAGVFTGTVKVSGEGTTLNLKGQLAQYVGLYTPNARNAAIAASLQLTAYWGADIELENGATLSFEQSTLNLSDTALWKNPLATPINALNFVKNLKSDASSKVVIGTDKGSRNRITFYTEQGHVSTIGQLSGNGRIYVLGDGYAEFIGKSELISGTDTTGNSWTAGNRLADIAINNAGVYIGATRGQTDRDALAAAVDNVFAGATAVHLGATAFASSFTDSTPTVTAGATAAAPNELHNTVVNVYGNQIFNNFQSLWLERSELLSDPDKSELRASEPYIFSYWDATNNTVVFSTGWSSSVQVGGGSVLTINQDAYRDGWFQGALLTSFNETAYPDRNNGEGLVVKTGKGKIFYDTNLVSSISGLSRLRIEDGTWVSSLSGVNGVTVQVVGDGVFELYVDTSKQQISPILKGSGDLSLTRFVLLENGLTAASSGSIGATDWEPEYRRYLVKNLSSSSAGVQFTKEQTQFTGSIIVNDGLTLSLGEKDGDEGTPDSPSIFSSAESIILRGVDPSSSRYATCDAAHMDILGNYILESYDGSSLQYAALDVLSGVQLVKNLVGEANYSRVYVEHGATLVLTRTSDTSFSGGISGNGNLINLGGSQAVRVDNDGDLFGTLSVLSGSASVTQTAANAGFSGLVLANGGRATFSRGDGISKVGMLVGEAGTTVSASGDFVVGDMSKAVSRNGTDGEYLATANYSAYEGYFSGTSVENVLYSLNTTAEKARAYTFTYKESDGSTAVKAKSHTVEDTLAYLKNPAKLIYTTDANVYDGAFSHLYATTGTDRYGNSVFAKMYSGAEAGSHNAYRTDFDSGTTTTETLFNEGETVAAWLRRTFKVDYVSAFINSSSAQLSASTKKSLLAMAQLIASGDQGVCNYLDGTNPKTANLNVEGWNKLVAAGALEYLKAAFSGSGISDLGDETLYSFITHFYPEDDTYEFVATEKNLSLISNTYGVLFPANTSANKDYATVVATFGVESTEFAGTLSGSLNLIKTGAETLKLTGVNSYTGTTTVSAGELYIDWNAIQNTAGIVVEEGALLTINGEKADIQKVHTNPETDSYFPGYGDESPGDLFVSGSSARLSGGGVVLKIGDGDVNLGNGLLGGTSADSYFTGTFLVAEGGLIGTINPKATVAPTFGIVFSEDSTSTFRLNFRRDGGTYVSRSASEGAVEVAFGGEITGVDGTGTFILDAGTSGYIGADGSRVFLGNNTLKVLASKFSPKEVQVESGDLKLDFDVADTTVSTSTYDLASGASLIFNLSETGAVQSTADIVGSGDNTLRIVSSETDSDNSAGYVKKTLALNNVAITGFSSLVLDGGASLTIGNLETARVSEIKLTSLSAGAQTALNLDNDRTLSLNVAPGKKSVIGGAFTGEGTFVFNDESAGKAAGTLVLGNTDASSSETVETGFSGTIVFENGTIEMAVGKDRTVKYAGLKLSGDGTHNRTRTLIKTGAGTAWIAPKNDETTSSISVKNLSVNVSEGTLKVGANLFAEGTLPEVVNIEKGATFLFTDPLDSFKLEDLGTLRGAGTLAFETSDTSAAITADKSAGDFKGLVSVGKNITLTLGADVETFAAFSGAGTVKVSSGKLTVDVNANDDAAQSFSGKIEGLTELTVVGEGILVLDEKPTDSEGIPTLTEVVVGSATQNGGFGTKAANNIAVTAAGAHSRIALTSLDANGGTFAGTVSVSESVSALDLLTDGTIALGKNAVSDAFKLKTADGEQFLIDGSVAVTLGNVAGKNLVLENLGKIGEEKFNLRTNTGGSIVFDGTTTTTSDDSSSGDDDTFAVTFADSTSVVTPTPTVWNADISGAGGITVQNGATLQLNASTLSYTGKTLVNAGSELIFGAEGGAVSSSSELEVASGGTLKGGVRLIGENTNVTFNDDSTFVFTGAAIEFTGTGQVAAGTLNVKLDAAALSVRGVPVALFRYIGTDPLTGGNDLTFDKLNIEETDSSLRYYKDSSSVAETGATSIYVVAPDLANAGVKLHAGTSSKFIRMLNAITQTSGGDLRDKITFDGETIKLKTDVDALGNTTLTDAGTLAETLIKTPNGSLAETLNNLSPLGYAAAPAMLQSGFLSDISAISARIEQRRYDNYSSFIWETHNDWEFFAQGQGTLVDSDTGTDSRTFDFNTFGAIAGADVKLDAITVAGFAVAYDFGKASLHDGGGNIKSNDIRATAFFGKLFGEKFYLDAGLQAGFANIDVKRRTVLGNVKDDTTGYHAGAFANFGVLLPLWLSEDEKTSINLMPFVGLAYSYFDIGSVKERGAGTALDTKSFDANSLRASIGASLAIAFPWLDRNTRVNLDVAYSRELFDSDTDIDYSMPGISGSEKYSVSAPTFTKDTFSLGPRFLIELDRNTSVYAGYRFEMSTDSDVSHSVNIGYRARF